MGNNCCQRSKNEQELQYGKAFDNGNRDSTLPPKELMNMQKNSINYKEAYRYLQSIQMFDPANHALPVALHHCMSKQCTGLKPTVKEVLNISQNYSYGNSKNYFDPKFLFQEYQRLEIQSTGSKCWDSTQLSKQYQIEFQDLKKQCYLSPYSSEVDSVVCILRKLKQSFAFSFKFDQFNIETQKKEFILHTLYPHIEEDGQNNTKTHFKGYDCGELAFEDISEFYEYLDTLFEDDEQYSISEMYDSKQSSQKSNDTTNESIEKHGNSIFIQLVSFLSINRSTLKSITPMLDEFQLQSTTSFVDLLKTLENDDVVEQKDESENQRCSYLSLKQKNGRFSHKPSQNKQELLLNISKQNSIGPISPFKKLIKKNELK